MSTTPLPTGRIRTRLCLRKRTGTVQAVCAEHPFLEMRNETPYPVSAPDNTKLRAFLWTSSNESPGRRPARVR